MTTETKVQHTPGRPVGFSFEIRDGIPTLPTEYPSDCGCTITAKQTGVGFDYCATHGAAPALLEVVAEVARQPCEMGQGIACIMVPSSTHADFEPCLPCHARQAIALAKGEQDA